MTTRTEHYQEAEKLLATAAGFSGTHPEWAMEYLTAAQVHATLALAEALAQPNHAGPWLGTAEGSPRG